MSRDANETYVAPAAPSARVEYTLEVTHTNAVSSTQVVDTEIDRGISRWSVAEYMARPMNTLNARWVRAIFLDGADAIMFFLRNFQWDINIIAWAWRWTLLRRFRSDTLKDGV